MVVDGKDEVGRPAFQEGGETWIEMKEARGIEASTKGGS